MSEAAASIAAEVSTGSGFGQGTRQAGEYSTMDPVLREIFRKETAGHILVVREFIERWRA